ncbi:MAG: hypothetical protein R3C10_22770 [Pirellulales bacterium]
MTNRTLTSHACVNARSPGVHRCAALVVLAVALLPLAGPARSIGQTTDTTTTGTTATDTATTVTTTTDVATPKPAVEIASCRIGFDGAYVVGRWTPVDIELQSTGGTTTVEVHFYVADGDGVLCRYPLPGNRPAQVTATAPVRVMGYVRFGRRDAAMRVTVSQDGEVISERSFSPLDSRDEAHIPEALASKSRLWVSVGGDLGAGDAAKTQRSGGNAEPIATAQVDDAAELPTRWFGYEGVDAVLLATSNPQVYRTLTVPGARIEALDRWVRLGGHLLLAGGSAAPTVLTEGAPLAQFLPAVVESDSVGLNATILQRFETYSGARHPLAMSGDVKLSIPRLAGVSGRVEARVADLPLIVRRPYGLGEVVFVSADLDRAPFAGWQARGVMLSRLLGLPPDATVSTDVADVTDTPEQVAQPGYDDLAGKLRGRLDQFNGVRLLPFWQVALLIVGYILLIGPIDYLLVHKLLGRAEWTWLSFPVMVAIACGGAYALGYSFKGERLLLNQIDLVDVDVAGGEVRGTCWFNVFSPSMARYEVTATASTPVVAGDQQECLTSWFGLPGTGLGGMDSSTSSLVSEAEAYSTTGSFDTLDDVPIAVWSTKSFTARWRAEAGPTIVADLTLGGDQVLSGKIESRLDFDLTDCHLVYSPASSAASGRLTAWAYPVETFRAGSTVRVDRRTDRFDAQTWLKDLRLVKDQRENQYGFRSVPFDAAAYDPPRDLRTMMFYEAIGGEQYAHLASQYQSFVDLTDTLEAGRAILVGRSEPPTTKIDVAGPSGQATLQQNWVFYRFVLPMTEASQ